MQEEIKVNYENKPEKESENVSLVLNQNNIMNEFILALFDVVFGLSISEGESIIKAAEKDGSAVIGSYEYNEAVNKFNKIKLVFDTIGWPICITMREY